MRAIWDVPSKRTWSWDWEVVFRESITVSNLRNLFLSLWVWWCLWCQIKNCYGEESKGVCVCVCVWSIGVCTCFGMSWGVWEISCGVWKKEMKGKTRRLDWQSHVKMKRMPRGVERWWIVARPSLTERRESPVFIGCWESSWTQWAFLFWWAMEVRRKGCNWGNRRETTINPVGLTRNGFHGFAIEGLNGGFPPRKGWSEL